MNAIQVGVKAPNFILKDGFNKEVQLSDYKGKQVLLSWHPLAWTGVCTDQMRSLEVHFDDFAAKNTVAIGLSVDATPSKKAWATALAIEKTPLVSDFWPQGRVSQDYGVFMKNHGFSGRVNVLVDEEGVVKWVKVYPIGELPDINEVLSAL
jgi:peroxiredoxin